MQVSTTEMPLPRRPSPIPNVLSLLRLMAGPPLFLAIKANDGALIALFGSIAVVTDVFDGFLARKLESITNAGKIIDPLADKLVFASVGLALVLYGDMPPALFAIIAARDLLIAGAGILIIRKSRVIPVSNVWGKIAVHVLAVVLLVYLIRIRQLYSLTFWLAIAFVIISTVSYFFAALRYLANKA